MRKHDRMVGRRGKDAQRGQQNGLDPRHEHGGGRKEAGSHVVDGGYAHVNGLISLDEGGNGQRIV